MKRNVKCMLMAILLPCATVSAQVASVEFFPQGKALAKTYEPMFIGCDGGQAIFVQMSGRLRNKMDLVSYDMEQNELVRMPVTEDKELVCYGGYINGDSVDQPTAVGGHLSDRP